MTTNDSRGLPSEKAEQPGQVSTETSAGTGLLSREYVLKLVLATSLVATILALSLSLTFYATTIISPYSSLAIFSALIVLVVLRRAWLDVLWVLAGASVLYLLDYRVMHFKPALMAGFSFVGLAAFVLLGIRTIWADRPERKFLLYGLVPVTLFVASEWMASTFLEVTGNLHPKAFDLFLYSFDASLRVQISFLVGKLFWNFLWLRAVCIMFYIALPLPLALVYAAQLRRMGPKAVVVMIAFLITGPIGVLFYNMLPACGPVHLFGKAFPFSPLSISQVAHMVPFTLPVPGARNAIPSLHITWVLLIWWNSKGTARWIRAIALSFVWATVLATLGTGEHYFIDLVVAFPFSLMIQALSSFSLPWREGPRWTALLFGTFCTLAWVALLSFETRLFWISPIIPWVMVVATVSTSVLLWHPLLSVFDPAEKTSTIQQEVTLPLVRAQGAS